MNKLITIIALLSFCVALGHAKAFDNLLVKTNDVVVEFSNDGRLAMLKHVKRGEKYNSWYIYNVEILANGDLHLTGLGEVKDDLRNPFLVLTPPSDIVISGIGTENLRMSGKFDSPLEKTWGGCFNYEQWKIAHSLADYNENSEQYSPDSVANLQNNAYALVSSWENLAKERSNTTRELRQAREQKTVSNNTKWCILVLIPFVLGIVIYQIQLRQLPYEYLTSLKWTVFNQILGIALSAISIRFIYAPWWAIVLAVLSMLGIQVTNIFSYLHFRTCVKEKLNGKIALLPAIVFGYVSMICFFAIISGLVLICIPGVHFEASTGEMIGGLLLDILFLTIVGLWYKKNIEKNAPELKGHFLPIAVMTMFAAVAVFSLIIVLIAWFIFKWTGKMSLDAASSVPDSSLKPADSTAGSCIMCGRLGDYSCPHFKEGGTPNFTCSSWIPR